MIKNTYVLPASLTGQIREEDAIMLTSQLQALPETLAQGVLESLSGVLGSQSLQNPVGWLLAVLKRAREGNFIRRNRSSASLHQPSHRRGQERAPLRNLLSPGNVQNPFQQSV